MDKNIINNIEKLKPKTYHSISNAQLANIPHLYKLNLEYKTEIHLQDSKYHNMNHKNVATYVCNNLPYAYNQTRSEFVDTLSNLYISKEVEPFFIFINGEFISSSRITIIKESNYSYIIISDILVKDIDRMDCILIRQDIIYNESSNIINNTLFAFDEGKIVEGYKQGLFTTINITNNKELGYFSHTIKDNESLQVVDYCDYNLIQDNILLFNDGLLDVNIDVDFIGLNGFKLKENINDKIHYKVFYYKNSNTYIDNIKHISNKNYMVNYVETYGFIPEFIRNLDKKFDFKFDKSKSYSENIKEGLEYIMNYNTSFMNDVYKNNSNYTSIFYTGKDFLDKKNNRGYTKMSRIINKDFSSNVIIFVNGELYKDYYRLFYKNKSFILPVISMKEDDIVEVVYVKNIRNETYDIVFNSNEDDTYFMSAGLEPEHIKIFTASPRNNEFNIQKYKKIQYEIPCVIEQLYFNKYKIYPKDSFYYDKMVSVSYDRQFRYHSMLIQEETIKVILPIDFSFCNNANNYMIFVNGRKLDMSDFKLTIPQENKPFDELVVYVNTIMNKGDRIDILYLPDSMDEVSLQPNINTNGHIVVDKSKIKYNLDNELYFFFINGKKINKNQITNIDQNKILVNVDTDTINNLSIIKHIDDNEILSTMFDKTNDIITDTFNNINKPTLHNLYIGEGIKDVESNVKDDSLDNSDVMRELIKDFYLRPYIYNGEEFVYDYDTDGVALDENGVLILGGENNE